MTPRCPNCNYADGEGHSKECNTEAGEFEAAQREFDAAGRLSHPRILADVMSAYDIDGAALWEASLIDVANEIQRELEARADEEALANDEPFREYIAGKGTDYAVELAALVSGVRKMAARQPIGSPRVTGLNDVWIIANAITCDYMAYRATTADDDERNEIAETL